MRKRLCMITGMLILAATPAFADSLNITYRDGSRQSLQLNQPAQNIRTLDLGEGRTATSSNQEISGIHRLKARHSGRCLDVAGVGTHNGANVQQWQCHDGDNQKWRFIPKGGNSYTIVALHSGRCLDVASPGRGNGDNVQQWDCHGGDNQLWNVVGDGRGSYRITARHSGRCLDVAGVATNDGANVHQWECHDGDNQKWIIE